MTQKRNTKILVSTQTALKTQPYPDNDKIEWLREYLVLPRRINNMLEFEYAVYPNQSSKDRGDEPFLYNSHKAQIRENHQRVLIGPNGGLMHVSGAEVLPEELEAFLETRDAYTWASKTDLVWTDNRGRQLTPFRFPSYSGVMENLDPQWLREKFNLPQSQQVAELLSRYDDGAMERRLSGDHRGTTLDLQVGAGADDGYTTYVVGDYPGSPLSFNTSFAYVTIGTNSSAAGNVYHGFYHFDTGISGLSGATIDVAYITLFKQFEVGTPETIIQAHDAATGVAPTSGSQHDGLTRTTASVTWDNPDISTGGTNSPSIVSVIQELANSYDPDKITILHGDDLNTDSDHRLGPASVENTTYEAPKLHIELTGAGGGAAENAPFFGMNF